MATRSVLSVIERIQLIQGKMSKLERDFRDAKGVPKTLREKMITLVATFTVGCLVGLLVVVTLLASV